MFQVKCLPYYSFINGSIVNIPCHLLSHAFVLLKKDLEQHILEKHLNNIREIAFDTAVPPQTRAICSFFEIKPLDNRYRDRPSPSVYAEGDIIFQTNMPGEVIEGDYTEVKQIGGEDANRTS